MNETVLQILRDVRKYKGDSFPVLCLVEEMSELAKELLKNINRSKDNRDDIIDEVSDVMVGLQNVKMIYNITDDELFARINEKMPHKWLKIIEKMRQENENDKQ